MIVLLFSFSTTAIALNAECVTLILVGDNERRMVESKSRNAEGCNPKAVRNKGIQVAAILAVH